MRTLAATALAFATLPAPAAASWTWPVRGPVLARFAYAPNHPFARGQRRGVDIAAPRGTPVVAACPGRVRFAGAIGASGRTVSQQCGGWVVSYLHLAGIATRRGAHLDSGEPIGTVGTTGRRREQRPHLSFGVRQATDRWGYVDPLRFLSHNTPSPPEIVPLPRRRTSPPLGAAPSGRPSPHAADPMPARGSLPSRSHAARRHQPQVVLGSAASEPLPLGWLWLPAGALLALAALGAPLARLRLKRRKDAVRALSLARRAA